MTWIAAVVAGVVGALAGAAARLLVGRLERGVVLPVGPVELLGAVLVPATVALTQDRGDGGVVIGLLLVCWVLLLAPVDAVRHRLPDAITLPAFPVTLVVVLGTTVGLDLPWWNLARGLLWALAVGGVALAAAAVSPRSLGWGDVKLLPTLALATGFLSGVHLGLALALAVLAAGLWSLGGVALRLLHRRSAVPLGPFLLLSAWFVVSWSW